MSLTLSRRALATATIAAALGGALLAIPATRVSAAALSATANHCPPFVPSCHINPTSHTVAAGHRHLTALASMTWKDDQRTAGRASFITGVDWGDGSVTTPAVRGGHGSFSFTGTHVYAAPGTYSVYLELSAADRSESYLWPASVTVL